MPIFSPAASDFLYYRACCPWLLPPHPLQPCPGFSPILSESGKNWARTDCKTPLVKAFFCWQSSGNDDGWASWYIMFKWKIVMMWRASVPRKPSCICTSTKVVGYTQVTSASFWSSLHLGLTASCFQNPVLASQTPKIRLSFPVAFIFDFAFDMCSA